MWVASDRKYSIKVYVIADDKEESSKYVQAALQKLSATLTKINGLPGKENPAVVAFRDLIKKAAFDVTCLEGDAIISGCNERNYDCNSIIIDQFIDGAPMLTNKLGSNDCRKDEFTFHLSYT